jgi:hypothetical protein
MMGGIGEKARQNRRDSIGKINSHVCDVIFKIQMGGHARGRSGMNECRNFRDDSAYRRSGSEQGSEAGVGVHWLVLLSVYYLFFLD